MTPRLSNKAYDEMWAASGFPKAENPFPKNSLVDFRRHRQTPSHSTTETRWLVKEGPNENDVYTLVKEGHQEVKCFGSAIRCHIVRSKDRKNDRFEQERIAQWVYDPDRFALYVAQLEDIINNPPPAGK